MKDVLSIACIRQISKETVNCILKLFGEEEVTLSVGHFEPDSICRSIPEKGGNHPMKFVVWEPLNSPGTSVFTCNREDGGYTIIYNLSRLFRAEAVQVMAWDVPQEQAAFRFYYFRNGEEERCIQLTQENEEWIFFEKGNPLPFENLDAHRRRRKRERVDRRIIEEYVGHLGWDIKSDAFWKSHGDVFCGHRKLG